jgi:hypothetical protein
MNAGFERGEVGQGFTFSGATSYLEVPDSPSLSFTSDFTIELWYKDTGLAQGAYAGLVAKRPYSGPCNYGLTITGGNQGAFLVYFLDPNYGSYQSSTYSSLPAPGAWHHLAASFRQVTNEQLEIDSYVDGTLVKTAAFQGNIGRTINNYPLHIGCSNPPGGEFFPGDIDEVSIYDRALLPSEVAAIFTAGPSGKCVSGGNLKDALTIQGPIVFQGQPATAFINLQAKGVENAVGFSLSFDPTVVTYLGASAGSDAVNSTMNINAIRAGSGQLGIALALPSDVSFSPGTRQLVKINFQAVSPVSTNTPVLLTDVPVSREVSDTNAISVATDYDDGTIMVNPIPSLAIDHSNENVTLAWPAWGTNYNLQESIDKILQTTSWTNLSMSPILITNAFNVTLPISNSHGLYRLHHQ